MRNIRNEVVECLENHDQDEGRLIEELDQLAKTNGAGVYSILLKVIAQIDFGVEESKAHWHQVVERRKDMARRLQKPVNFTAAACDYFETLNASIPAPKTIEMHCDEENPQITIFDDLTKLFNRGYLEIALAAELNRSEANGLDFSVIFFDIDHFQDLNDQHGPQTGDSVLRILGEAILSYKRAEDVAGRYGGQEILMILPDTTKERALGIAESIRERVMNLSITHKKKPLQLTLSGGVASFPEAASNIKGIMHGARTALFQAKNGGRNQVVSFSGGTRNFIRVNFTNDIMVAENNDSTEMSIAKGKNMSPSGILFTSEKPYPVDSYIQMRIPVNSPRVPVLLRGRVVRVEPNGTGFENGVSFLEHTEDDNHEIAHTLANYLGIPMLH